MNGDSFEKEKFVVWKHAEQDDVAAALSVALRRRRKRGYVERTDLTAGKAVCVA
jgi:predicted DNA-binding WGR domain protein